MPNEWFYFGCHREAGHYLFLQGMRSCWRHGWPRELSRFDGMLPPQTDTAPYIATVSRLGGWGMTALAFWDYSVDKRGGCNSIVFAPSLTITPEDLLAQAQVRFPEVFNRLPQPVTFASGVTAVQPAQHDEDEQWAVDRGADLLEHYAEYIRRVKPEDIEQHPYLPELEAVAVHLRALSKRSAAGVAVMHGQTKPPADADGAG